MYVMYVITVVKSKKKIVFCVSDDVTKKEKEEIEVKLKQVTRHMIN
jgi:hypothetical protein